MKDSVTVIDVDGRHELQFGYDGRIDIRHAPKGVLCQQMSTATVAPFSNAGFCLFETTHMFAALGDLDSVGWP